MEKEPIIFDGIEYEWKKVGCLFGLYPVEWGPELPALDLGSYQPKKQEPTQSRLFDMGVYGD